jgi:hypothetical protein
MQRPRTLSIIKIVYTKFSDSWRGQSQGVMGHTQTSVRTLHVCRVTTVIARCNAQVLFPVNIRITCSVFAIYITKGSLRRQHGNLNRFRNINHLPSGLVQFLHIFHHLTRNKRRQMGSFHRNQLKLRPSSTSSTNTHFLRT